MSTKFIPGQELFDPKGRPIKGRLFVRSAHYTYIGRTTSSFVLTVHISGPNGLNNAFENEFYSIIFNDSIHIDIRPHETAYASDYTDPDSGEFNWERGELFLEGISGFEQFSHSRFLRRFGVQEPIHGPYEGEEFKDAKHLPWDFRFAGTEQVIHILTTDIPIITPSLKDYTQSQTN